MKNTDSGAKLSDLDLQERVRIFLNQRSVPSLRHVSVTSDNGTVRLRGRVRTFYEKQLCLSCCKHVAGVVKVVDEIGVERKAADRDRAVMKMAK